MTRISSVSNVMETYYKLTQTPSEMEEELKKELSNQNKQQSGDTSTLDDLTEVVGTIKDEIQFLVIDEKNEILVSFKGSVPNLFSEGKGVVAEGKLVEKKIFFADKIMAKHDEKYMPREVADKLKEQGVWQGETSR